MLPEHHIYTILSCINKHVAFSENIEISLESDPGTFNKNKADSYNKMELTDWQWVTDMVGITVYGKW